MFYPTFAQIDSETLYTFAGEGIPLPANTPVKLLARPPLLGQPCLVYHQPTGAYAAVPELHLADYAPASTERTVELHFLNVATLCAGGVNRFLATSDEKDAALAQLGITRQAGQGHLAAWVLAMARINQLPEVFPCHIIGDAALEDREIAKWIWFLA